MRLLFSLLLLVANTLHAQTERKLETLLLMPEPKAMRSAYSIVPAGAKQTVLTPYRESTVSPGGIEP